MVGLDHAPMILPWNGRLIPLQSQLPASACPTGRSERGEFYASNVAVVVYRVYHGASDLAGVSAERPSGAVGQSDPILVPPKSTRDYGFRAVSTSSYCYTKGVKIMWDIVLRSRPAWLAGLVLCVVGQTFADPPLGYYDSVDATDSASLRATLHEVIDDHARFPYTSSNTDTWDILELADEDPNDSDHILDVYRNTSFQKTGGGNGPYNREHTWPSSYGFPDDGSGNYPYTDCHMLFLCHGGYNSSRGNNPYRYCNSGCAERTTQENNGQGGGGGVYPGNSNWRTGQGRSGTWETWTGRRGDVARALLYADVRYEGGVHEGGASEPDLILTDDNDQIVTSGRNADVAYMGMLAALLQWHAEDPVDDVERARNDVVFSFQTNRNPFIDHPEWAACVFIGECGSECPWDLDDDGMVDATDLGPLLGAWGPNPGHPADFNFDGTVNAFDLGPLLGAWGPCEP